MDLLIINPEEFVLNGEKPLKREFYTYITGCNETHVFFETKERNPRPYILRVVDVYFATPYHIFLNPNTEILLFNEIIKELKNSGLFEYFINIIMKYCHKCLEIL